MSARQTRNEIGGKAFPSKPGQGVRSTFSSALLLARETGGAAIQSKRGDEHLCARCAKKPGQIRDDEGRLICRECAPEAA